MLTLGESWSRSSGCGSSCGWAIWSPEREADVPEVTEPRPETTFMKLKPVLSDLTSTLQGFPGGTYGKESACQCRRLKRCRFYPWVKKIPWSRKRQSIPVFMPGRFPWTGETGGLQSIRLQRLRHDWARTHTHTHPPARTVKGWHFDLGRRRWMRQGTR